jgi:prophage tail gpP-like protein
VYGDDNKSLSLRRANPGVAEPIRTGTVLNVPADTSVPTDNPQGTLDTDPDETTIKIDGKRFRGWDGLELKRSVDGVSSVVFSAPFDSSSPGQRETFRPLQYKSLVVQVGNERYFTGTLVTPISNGDPNQTIVELSGYGYPGVLEDCTAPVTAFPLELNGLSLREIADTVAGFYNVGAVFEADAGAKFRRVKLEADGELLPFLIDLAQQRNLVIADTKDGDLLFHQSAPAGSPVARLRQGEQPLLRVAQAQNPQKYFSHITVFRSTRAGSRGDRHTVTNPRASGYSRSRNIIAKDGRKADVQVGAEAALGRMFAEVATYEATVATWRDPKGNLWEPNTTIQLLYPDAMIYDWYEFFIRDVTLSKNANEQTATLALTFPGAFAGEAPEGFPWDD